MNRKRLLVITILLIALSAFLFLNTFGTIGIGIAKEFQTISKGDLSDIEGMTEEYYVVQNDDDWVQIWTRHASDALPKVNFSEMTIIAVFMGWCPSMGYAIEIKSIVDTGLSIVVKVEESRNGNYTGQMVTHPFHIVQVDKLNKWVVFKTWFTQIQ